MQKGSVPNASDLKKEAALQEIVAVETQVEEWGRDLEVALELDMRDEVEECKTRIEKLTAELERLTAEEGPYDECECFIRISAGEGGTEANDWCEMVTRMYNRFVTKQGFDWVVTDWSPGTVTGYKFVQVKTDMPFKMLKGENGVHRLVRVSPFDAKGRRHTSFSAVEVLPQLEKDDAIEIRAEDLRVDTFRSGGPGGQYQNTTESGVRITHLPTGLVAESREERSQIQNREIAMQRLKGLLAVQAELEHQKELDEVNGPKCISSFGSQIRSYIFMPYQMVRDERTGYSVGNVEAVLDGELEVFYGKK